MLIKSHKNIEHIRPDGMTNEEYYRYITQKKKFCSDLEYNYIIAKGIFNVMLSLAEMTPPERTRVVCSPWRYDAVIEKEESTLDGDEYTFSVYDVVNGASPVETHKLTSKASFKKKGYRKYRAFIEYKSSALSSNVNCVYGDWNNLNNESFAVKTLSIFSTQRHCYEYEY